MRRVLGGVLMATVLFLASCGGPPGGTPSEGARSGDSGETSREEEPTPLAVAAVEVVSEPLLREVSGSGIVRGSREATVVSETEGVLDFVDFQLGVFVEAGRPLAGVDDRVARLNYEQAQQQFELAQIELDAAERRAQTGIASQAELRRARSALSGASARVEQTREVLEAQTLTAPISGYIASKAETITEGNYLRRGTEVARIVDLSRLELQIAVGEREVRFLEVGSPARITIPSCEQGTMDASVQAIAAGSDRGTGSFPVLLSWENECGDIRSGVSGSARIRPTNQRNRLIVPAASLVDGSNVFVAREGVARLQEVTVDERLGERAAIASGIEAGEVVLVSGLTVLADGDPIEVTIREEWSE